MMVSRKALLLTSAAFMVGMTPPAAAQVAAGEGIFTMLGRIVLGAGAPKVAIEAPQSITVLEAEDFDRAQPRTVGDVIAQAPGISTVGTESKFGESINIRGIGTGTSADEPRIVTLIDGVKKYYESYRQGSLFTDPEFFKDVEILRGPGSSTLYGSGAVGGVVSFETKDAADFVEGDDTFALRQKVEYKSNGQAKESSTFLAFRPDDSFDGLIGVIVEDSDFMTDGSGNDILGTKITETNLLAKGTYTFGKNDEHAIEGGVIRYRGEADNQLLDVIDNSTTFGTVDRTVTDTTVYTKYSFDPVESDMLNLEVQLAYSESKNEVDNTNFPVIPGFDLTVFDADYAYQGTGVRVVNTAEWISETTENYLTFGLELSQMERISVRATADNAAFQPTGVSQTASIFAQNEWILNDRFTILTGGRLDFQRSEPGSLVPTTDIVEDTGSALTVALHHQTTDNLAFFGSVSRTERLPVVDELFDSRATTSGADQVSVGTLDPEVSVNVELGASFSRNDAFVDGDQVQLKATAFRNNLTDMIARNNTGAAGEPTYVNVDEVNFTGFELEGAYESERLFGSLALTVMDGENVSDPTAINPNLENRIPADTLRLSFGTRLPEHNLTLGWTGTYYAEKSRFASAMGITTETRTPSNLIHDVFAVWTPDAGALAGTEMRLGVSNVLDVDYRTHLQSTAVRRAGRSINLTLTKTF